MENLHLRTTRGKQPKRAIEWENGEWARTKGAFAAAQFAREEARRRMAEGEWDLAVEAAEEAFRLAKEHVPCAPEGNLVDFVRAWTERELVVDCATVLELARQEMAHHAYIASFPQPRTTFRRRGAARRAPRRARRARVARTAKATADPDPEPPRRGPAPPVTADPLLAGCP